jgi:hypothetical protein
LLLINEENGSFGEGESGSVDDGVVVGL